MSKTPAIGSPTPGNLRKGVIIFFLLIVGLILTGIYILNEIDQVKEQQDKIQVLPSLQSDS